MVGVFLFHFTIFGPPEFREKDRTDSNRLCRFVTFSRSKTYERTRIRGKIGGWWEEKDGYMIPIF